MKRIGQDRLELALLALIAVICTGLSILQYRWTGEFSRAERERLRTGLSEQASRLARAFEDDLRRNCRALVPEERTMQEAGFLEAHRSRYTAWAAAHDDGFFSRVAVAAPEEGILKLCSLKRGGEMRPMEWPESWLTLRKAMTRRLQGTGKPPSVPLDTTLIEMPIFGSRQDGRDERVEIEWMIFEVSEDHIRNKVLPPLIDEYLDTGDNGIYDVSVTWTDPRRGVVYSTLPGNTSVAAGADVTAGLFNGNAGGAQEGRKNRAARLGQGTGAPTRWTLAVRHREGSLDQAVAHARTRNFLTALILIGLLGGTAWALVRHTSRSRHLADMQFRFAAGVSHDLRTPLTAIRGAAFNLADGVVTEPGGVKRYARLILRNAEELTSMIENVLAFSATLQPVSGERREMFSVGDLLDHAAAAMAQEVEDAGCRIEVIVAPDLPVVCGDPLALQHAFRNLIANATRHAPQGKWIGVSAARRGDGLEIRFTDRGPGIPETEWERIFEPFHCFEPDRASQVRGTGLGLSLVKETVERHRGTITVQSSPSGGAQFVVFLPGIPEAG